MCSNPSVILSNGASSTTAMMTEVPMITAIQLRHRRDAYYLIDIREAEEIAADPLIVEEKDNGDADEANSAAAERFQQKIKADIEVPMGKLLAKGLAEEWIDQKGIVLLCNSGHRASITARELAKVTPHTKVMALQHGLMGLRHPAAISPDMVVVLATHTNAEKITLALNAAAVAASSGDTVVLALMGEGVVSFLRKGNNKMEEKTTYLVEETYIGEPFQPCAALLKKFVGSGNGVVLACKSCLKSRGLELGSDLIDCVQPMQMPDLVRMLGEANKTLQFM